MSDDVTSSRDLRHTLRVTSSLAILRFLFSNLIKHPASDTARQTFAPLKSIQYWAKRPLQTDAWMPPPCYSRAAEPMARARRR